MAIVFGKTGPATQTASVVDAVFDRDTVVLDEAAAEAKVSSGQVSVIRNFRKYTAQSAGRKNPNMGRDMLNFAALGPVPVNELPRLVERLRALHAELTTALV